jgi:hypothetical protein
LLTHEASPGGDGHVDLARPLSEEAERAQGHVTQVGVEHPILDGGDLLARELTGRRSGAGWPVVEAADVGGAVPRVIARWSDTDDSQDQHQRQYRLGAGDRAQHPDPVVASGNSLATEAEAGDPQQREQEPDDRGKDPLASCQLLDPVEKLLPALAELFDRDHGARAAASPRGDGRARDLELMQLRQPKRQR